MKRWSLIIGLMAAIQLIGCREDMTDQPKLKPLGTATAFVNDAAARQIPPNVVARTETDTARPNVDLDLLRRGRERFNAYCSPCHGEAGYGQGIVVQRGFPQPPSFHSGALRNIPAQRIYDVITKGQGVMYSYADRVASHDRWAIVAYIRALQLSQRVDVDKVPDAGEALR